MVGLLVGGITLPSYHLIQAREAAVVGLLVGSLSASYRQPLLKALKALCKVCCRECYTLTQPQPFTLIPTPTLPLTLTLTLTFTLTKARGRKCYVFIMGKLNSAKLANFAEVQLDP